MSLQKSYETKQYKKGLKAADAILKKFPDHGGTHFQIHELVMDLLSFYCHASVLACSYSWLFLEWLLNHVNFLIFDFLFYSI